METVGYVFGILALLWCIRLSSQVAKLERTMKENGIGSTDKSSLREILEKNTGRLGKIKFESKADDYEISSRHCLLVDVDEDWLLVRIVKSGAEKLIRIDSISSIQFK